MTRRRRKMSRRLQEELGMVYDPRRFMIGSLVYVETQSDEGASSLDDLQASFVEALAAQRSDLAITKADTSTAPPREDGSGWSDLRPDALLRSKPPRRA